VTHITEEIKSHIERLVHDAVSREAFFTEQPPAHDFNKGDPKTSRDIAEYALSTFEIDISSDKIDHVSQYIDENFDCLAIEPEIYHV
jgi:hypothetical protein